MTPLRLQRILVHVDPRSEDSRAISAAIPLAQANQAKLTLIDVVPDFSWPMQVLTGVWEQTIERISGSKRKLLKDRAESLSKRGVETDYVMLDGRLSVAIVRQAMAGDYDLVMKVAEGPTVNRSGFLGSTDLRLLRKCPCPVLVLKHDDQVGFQRIVAALDVMDENTTQRDLDRRVLAAAMALRQGSLEIVYAVQPVREAFEREWRGTDLLSDQQLSEWDDRLASASRARLEALAESTDGLDVDYHVLHGHPAVAITDYVGAHECDLLVMGTVGRSGMDGLLIGNTADSILDRVSCSVLALKPAEFVSPIK